MSPLLVVSVASASAAREDPDATPLPWRVGGRIGFTVDAAAFPDSQAYTLDVFVRVTPATIASLARDEQQRSQLRLTAQLHGAFGGGARTATQEFQIDPDESAGGFGKVVLLRFRARPGPHRLEVKLEDLLSRKRGLAYIGRRVHEFGSIDGEVQVPAPQAGRDLSDLEFVWSEEPTRRASPFWRSGRRVLPNPERLYGLLANEVHVLFQARAGEGDVRPWRWIARVLDPAGRVVAQRESTSAASRRMEADVAIDLAHEPAGGYDVEVKAWQEGDAGALLRRAHFSLAWREESWLRNPGEVEDVVHFLLSTDEAERFARLHPGEQERYLEDFWLIRDPTPDTAENEARDEYLKRVKTANRVYGGTGLSRGMFSDMGRVFIRYGEPGEVLHQVIPAGDQTLLQIIGELSRSEDRPIGEVHQKGPGGDMRPFEVWIYEGEIPLPPDADPRVERNTGRRRLVFLFVDELGTGDYTLRYSTE